MEIVIKGKNMDVPQKAKEYIEKKADKFDRLLRNISTAKVELSEEKTRSKENRYIVEVTVDAQGTFLRAEERGGDIFSAVDSVADVMDRQIRRYKERIQGKKQRRTAVSKGKSTVLSGSTLAVDEEQEKLIKVKSFPVTPMTPDDAIDQMVWLGHDFFVFFNEKTEQFNVVYRRKDGHYGLIEPELE